MKLTFWKMHGLGNDFIVLDSRTSGYVPKAAVAARLCRRRFGIGADQILVLLRSEVADYRMVILNSDGGEVEMCGNGIRALALFLRRRRISRKRRFRIETLAGIIAAEVIGGPASGRVRVDMGEPIFEPSRIPVALDQAPLNRLMEVEGNRFYITAVSMGNPHCVIPVDRVEGVPLAEFGPRLEHHPWFPKRTNVEFVQVLSRRHLKVRVWERGAGITLACGTGACAVLVAMVKLGQAERKATVSLPGGDLQIEWAKSNHVLMTGPAEMVFQGSVEI
jgi:diaminopimelate epimerase